MYKINNLGETLSYMIRLDAYHQQSLFFSYKRTKQQTLKIMKINTNCGVIVPIITNQCGVALFRKLKTAGKARLLVFSTCLSSVLHSVYFKFITIFKNRQEYCCKTFWCPSVSFIKCLKRSSCFEEHTVSLIYGHSTNVCVLLWCV